MAIQYKEQTKKEKYNPHRIIHDGAHFCSLLSLLILKIFNHTKILGEAS
jgi:hypothetical protein